MPTLLTTDLLDALVGGAPSAPRLIGRIAVTAIGLAGLWAAVVASILVL